MLRWKAACASLMMMAVLLAGCSDEGKKDPVQDAQFDDLDVKATEETGVILGVVVDASITPLAGVTVTVEPGGDQATSDGQGRFAFDGLEAGSYFVRAEKAGYIPAEQSVDVVAGVQRPEIIKVLLEPDPTTVPYVSVDQFNGFIECSFTLVLVSYAACAEAEDFNNNVFIDFVSFEPNVQWIQSEMVWVSSQQLGDSMSLSYTDPSTGVQVGMNSSAGTSPVLVTLNQTLIEQFELGTGREVWMRIFSTSAEGTDVIEEETWNEPWRSTVYPTYNSTVPPDGKDAINGTFHDVTGTNPIREDCVGWAALFASCMRAGGVGAVLQQEYAVYTHAFYNYQPATPWRFTEASEPPAPV